MHDAFLCTVEPLNEDSLNEDTSIIIQDTIVGTQVH